jgi:transcriptional regulator with XRE-family HTH domain
VTPVKRDPAAEARDAADRRRALELLADVRRRMRLSQYAVARLMNTRQSAVSDIEKGRRSDLHISTLQRYARAVGARIVLRVMADDGTIIAGADDGNVKLRTDVESRYVERGKARHAVRRSATGGLHVSAQCGVTPKWFGPGWLGSGTQREYEHCEALPPCRRCIMIVGPF